jgi:hypothetical protein
MYPLSLVRSLVRFYADLAGYDGHVLVTLDRRRFDRACRRYRLTPADDEDYGESIVDATRAAPLVWMNVPANRSMARLTRTAAHEALHVARPSMPHGRAFDRGVTKMLRGEEPDA